MAKSKSIINMAKALNSGDKRGGIRFEPDPGTIALIELQPKGKSGFTPTVTGLITEESHRGCGIVVKMVPGLEVGCFCKVKVGHNPALKAEVRWRVELDSQIARIGVMYLE